MKPKAKSKASLSPGKTLGKTKVNFYFSDWVLACLREKYPKGERGRFVEDAVIKCGKFQKEE